MIRKFRPRTEQSGRRRPMFVRSASFLVVVTDEPGFRPCFRLPGIDGHQGEPELWLHESTPRWELLALLAAGEVQLLPETRN